MPVPYVALTPGPTKNTLGNDENGRPLIAIQGRKVYRTTGHLNFTTVTYRGGPGGRIDLFTALTGWLSGDTAIVPEETIFPKDESQKQIEQENTRQMQNSQQSAEAAALRDLGIPVTTRVVIEDVQKGRPADGVLEPGDEIIAVNGTEATSVTQIVDVMARQTTSATPSPSPTSAPAKSTKPTSRPSPTPPANAPSSASSSPTSTGSPSRSTSASATSAAPPPASCSASPSSTKLTPGPLTQGKFIAGTGTITPKARSAPSAASSRK